MMVIYYLEKGKVKHILKKDGERQSDVQEFKNEHKTKDLLYYDLINEEMIDIDKYEDGIGISGVVMPNGDFVHIRHRRHKVFAWCYRDLELDDNLLLMSSDCRGGSNGMSHVSITKNEALTEKQLGFIKKHRNKFDERQVYNIMIGERFGFNKRDMI